MKGLVMVKEAQESQVQGSIEEVEEMLAQMAEQFRIDLDHAELIKACQNLTACGHSLEEIQAMSPEQIFEKRDELLQSEEPY